MRIAYIAYPTSLALRSANAIQTHTTLRELRALAPDTLAMVPRWLREPSRFSEVGARHLPRPAIGKLSRLHKSTLWYYAERSLFAAMTAAVVGWEQLRGRPVHAVYVREVICAFWWTALWGRLLGLPVIFEAHDLESWNPSRARERWAQPLLHLLDRVALSSSSAVVSLTDDFRRLLDRLGWRRTAEVAVIPDAFDESRFTSGSRAAARHALGIPEGVPLLVYSGMTFAYRGLDRLLHAVAALRERDPQLLLALVGGRPQELTELYALAKELGISDALILTGQIPQEQALPYLHAADLLVIPDTVTDVTASPLKLFEYLATERAVVLPDIPALAEILPPSVGYTFRRGDLEDMTAVLRRALSDSDRFQRERLGREIVAPHTYAARAAAILATCAAVLSGAEPASATAEAWYHRG